MNLFKLHSELAERLRLKLGWSHYAIYWVSFIKGVAVTCLGALADVLGRCSMCFYCTAWGTTFFRSPQLTP